MPHKTPQSQVPVPRKPVGEGKLLLFVFKTCVRARAYVRACIRACVCAYVRACVRVWFGNQTEVF